MLDQSMTGPGWCTTWPWLGLADARPGHDWVWLVHDLAMTGSGWCSTRLWLVLADARLGHDWFWLMLDQAMAGSGWCSTLPGRDMEDVLHS